MRRGRHPFAMLALAVAWLGLSVAGGPAPPATGADALAVIPPGTYTLYAWTQPAGADRALIVYLLRPAGTPTARIWAADVAVVGERARDEILDALRHRYPREIEDQGIVVEPVMNGGAPAAWLITSRGVGVTATIDRGGELTIYPRAPTPSESAGGAGSGGGGM